MPTSDPLEGVTSAPSPDGSSVARLEEGDLISIANSDGSQRREISSDCGGYGLAAWSPDGRYILVMSDSTGRDAVINACSVQHPPFNGQSQLTPSVSTAGGHGPASATSHGSRSPRIPEPGIYALFVSQWDAILLQHTAVMRSCR